MGSRDPAWAGCSLPLRAAMLIFQCLKENPFVMYVYHLYHVDLLYLWVGLDKDLYT